MIEDGDCVVVGVSGGLDSLVLVDVLLEFSKRVPFKFSIFPVSITLGTEDVFFKERLEEFFRSRGIESYKIVDAKILEGLEDKKNRCYWCSRRRRKLFFEQCERIGSRKVALGHVKEDFVEAFLMNILFSGETGCFKPCQAFFGGRFFIIRPMVYVEKKLVKSYARYTGLCDISEPCPYSVFSKREVVKEIIGLASRYERRVVKNVFSAIGNINREYLFEG